MLYNYIRILEKINGTLIDVSLENQDETQSYPAPIVTTDSIYIGQLYPFNSFFVQMQEPNLDLAQMNVSYWAGKSHGWQLCRDVLDGTNEDNITLSQSGVVQFFTNKNKNWIAIDDEIDSWPTDFPSLNIYDLYWAKISFNANLDPLTFIKRITYAFTRSQQLDELDVSINEFLPSFGKTNWDDWIVTASRQVISDLKRRNWIVAPGQVVYLEDLTQATDLKTLILIYKNLGKSYEEKLLQTQKEYELALSLAKFKFVNGLPETTIPAKQVTVGRLFR